MTKSKAKKRAACRICGCTETNACITSAGPCHWVEPDLCSARVCVGKARIIAAIHAKRAAKEEIHNAMAALYPVGAQITWEKRGHEQHGEVLGISDSGYLRVENARTGKSYFVGFYDTHGYVGVGAVR